MKIANKIVLFLLTAAVFPMLLTQTLIRLVLSVNQESLAYSLLKLLLGEDNNLTSNKLGIEDSAIELFKLVTGRSEGAFGIDVKTLLSSLPAEFAPVKRWVLVSAILIVVGIIVTIVILGCIFFTNAYKTITCLGLGGCLCFFASIFTFGRAAKPLLDGTIDLGSLLADAILSKNTELGSNIASAVLADAIKVDSFALGGAVSFAAFLMLGVAVWEFAYFITLPKAEEA